MMSVNKIKREKYFFFKNHAEKKTRKLTQELFSFFKKALYESRKVVSTFVLTYFGSPRFGHATEANCIKFQAVDPRYAQFRFLRKGSGARFHLIFCMTFEKIFLIFY